MESELGEVVLECKGDAPFQMKVGVGIALTGIASFMFCLVFGEAGINILAGLPLLYGVVGPILGIVIVIVSLVKWNNRLVVHDHGMVQHFAWRTESLKWSEMAEIAAWEQRHYASGVAYAMDIKATILMKNGKRRPITAVKLNRRMIAARGGERVLRRGLTGVRRQGLRPFGPMDRRHKLGHNVLPFCGRQRTVEPTNHEKNNLNVKLT
jgi:hypothetical protein